MVVFVIYLSNIYSQMSVIPPSPEVSALGKYGEYPVSLYTGVPGINIPIYNLKHKDFSLPISVSYHASGIKVNEEASNVGLGWVLNFGGVISRSVCGLPDDESLKGYYFKSTNIPESFIDSEFESISNSDQNFVYDIYKEQVDAEPDKFFINFNGVSGVFVFNEKKEIVLPHGLNLKINPDFSNNTWTVTDRDGIKYYFGGTHCEGTTNKVIGSTQPNKSFISSWFLYKIELRNGDIIHFEYEEERYTKRYHKAKTKVLQEQSIVSDLGTESQSESSFTSVRIRKVTFPNGSVNFLPGSKREDYKSTSNCYPIKDIIVKDNYGDTVRHIVLNTSYFISNEIDQVSNYKKHLYKRLRLDSICDLAGEFPLKLYGFKYNDNLLPNKLSPSIDFGGYFNGSNNTNEYDEDLYIPSYNAIHDYNIDIVKYKRETSGGWKYNGGLVYKPYRIIPELSSNNYGIRLFKYTGANKNPNLQATLSCILKEISYPTGDLTNFEFELNDYKLNTSTYQFVPKNIDFRVYARGERDSTFIFTEIDTTIARITVRAPTANDLYLQEVTGSIRFYLYDITDKKYYGPFWNSEVNLNTNQKIFQSEDIIMYPDHEYKVYVKVDYSPDGIDDEMSYVKYKINWEGVSEEKKVILNENTSGLRIKKIKNISSNLTRSSVIEYKYMKGDSSSGFLVDVPSYFESAILLKIINGTEVRYPVLQMNSNSVNVLGTTKGGQVGYGKVTQEYYSIINQDSIRNGKIVTSYDTPNIFPDKVSGRSGSAYYWNQTPQGSIIFDLNSNEYNQSTFPYAPRINYDWKRGLKRKKVVYNNQNKIVDVTNFEYEYDFLNDRKSIGLKVKQSFLEESSSTSSGLSLTATELMFTKYDILFNKALLKRETNTKYDVNGENPITYIKEFNYDSYYQLSNKTIYSDEINRRREEIKYSYDFSYPICDSMVSKNMLLPIEDRIYRNNDVITRKKTNFEYFGDLIMSSSVEEWNELGGWDTLFNYNKYDSKGNILQYTKPDNISVSFVWGHNGLYPLAKLEGVEYDDIPSALKTNIDKLDDNLSTSQLKLTNQLIRGNDSDGIMITTFTYKPLVGMTSQTDPNGKTTYYEYDDFGRLKTIKDNEENVIKEVKYKYATEQ